MEPKNLISENLFSKGELFLDNKAYTGPYNIKADGSYHTLSKFVENKSKKLTTKQESRYQKLLKITGGTDVSLKNKQVVGSVTLPKPDDYEKGFYTRYFIFRKGTKIIIEVDDIEINNVGATISEVLYEGFQLDWKISGPLNDKFDDKGVRQESGVRDTNRRTLQRIEKDYPGISERLQNLTQFYRNF
tara:strand:+ start:580 stop:1143 length:564 start_codon:yes stop_codon:yes gene_type:complete